MKFIKNFLNIIPIGIFFTILSLLIPRTVYTVKGLKTVSFGWPIPFVKQNLSAVDRPFPYMAYISSPWENPTNILWLQFIILILLFTLTVAIPIFLYRKYKTGKV